MTVALALSGFVPQTMAGRIGGVGLAVAILLGTIWLAHRQYSVSFVNGFLVAVGIFLTFDLFLVHWVLELHRVTSGPEALWIEITLFTAGLLFAYVGLRREYRKALTQTA
ncbi:MAG: DUF2243 domain-containing protein [Acidimicrobiia bacterium]